MSGNNPDRSDDLYARAGIHDVAAFYRTKFVSDEVLHADYFHPLNRFDLRFARTMWVYDSVRAGSSVLDLGCGAGMLALLKRKDVALFGADLSDVCARAAMRNGYDVAVQAELHTLPFPAATFDYVASLDVIGHIPMAQKDDVLREIRRVLKPGGVTLHGIECTDPANPSYEEMTDEQLRRFIDVDGHVGLETEQGHAARFRRFFPHVEWRSRFGICLRSEEFLKQADQYGAHYPADWLDYLRNLSFAERRSFDMAMGYVFSAISDMDVHLPPTGFYVFVKASDARLGPFYNEHRDRSALLQEAPLATPHGTRCLDRDPAAIFDDGWYEANDLPPVARWLRSSASISFSGPVSRMRFDAVSHMPDLEARPLVVDVSLDGTLIERILFTSTTWRHITITVPERLRRSASGGARLQLRASRTWRPRPHAEHRDDRELSIAVCNIEVEA